MQLVTQTLALNKLENSFWTHLKTSIPLERAFNQHFDLAVCRCNGFIVITLIAFAQDSGILGILCHSCFKSMTLLMLKIGMVMSIHNTF